MSATVTRTKSPLAVIASKRGQSSPHIESEGAAHAGNVLLETEIGTIASNWKVAPLSAICEPPQYGFTASAEEHGNVRFLRITDITDSGVKWPSFTAMNAR